jgi:hypothetical protein
MGACSAPPEISSRAPGLRRGFAGDVANYDAPASKSAAAPAPQAGGGVLFLDFGGELMQQSTTDDATRNHSVIATVQIPPFNGAVDAPKVSQQQAEDAVTDRVRSYYADFNLAVVTTRPSAGGYTLAAIGGHASLVGAPAGVAGLSLVDCGNTNLSNVVYDFSDDLSPDYGGVVAAAIAAAHEAGHSFGLEHSDNPQDVMYEVMNPQLSIQGEFLLGFHAGNFSGFNGGSSEPTTEVCGYANPIDNHAVLLAALGPSARTDTTAPTLTWSFPPMPPSLPQVTPTFPVSFQASDNVSVKRLEVYKNLELIAVLYAPPYTTTVTAASGETFDLTVEAMDDAANRTAITRQFIADSKNPPLCPDPGACPTGRTCVDGLCRLPLGSPCSSSVDCTTSFCQTFPGDTQKTCTGVCSATMICPENGMCVGGLCRPSAMPPMLPKNNGDPCGAGGECASGRCSTVCVPACDANTACSDPTAACQDVDGGKGCVPNGGMTTSNSCAIAPRPDGAALWLFGCALALVALRKRRRQ